MILTGAQIAKEIESNRIVFEPFDRKHCNPNSVNFHLDSKLLRYKRPGWLRRAWNWLSRQPSWELSLRQRNEIEEIEIPEEGYVLKPGELYLGCTVEIIGSEHYAPLMAARSSMGRLGLFIFLNSGLGDIGFKGQWTLELLTIHPIRLHVGDRIGQMMFFKPEGEVVQYTGKYQNSVGPISSLIYRDGQLSSSVFKDCDKDPKGPHRPTSGDGDGDSILYPLRERFLGHTLHFVEADDGMSGPDWVRVELDGVVLGVKGRDRGVKYFESRGILKKVLGEIEEEIRRELRMKLAEETVS